MGPNTVQHLSFISTMLHTYKHPRSQISLSATLANSQAISDPLAALTDALPDLLAGFTNITALKVSVDLQSGSTYIVNLQSCSSQLSCCLVNLWSGFTHVSCCRIDFQSCLWRDSIDLLCLAIHLRVLALPLLCPWAILLCPHALFTTHRN